MSISEDGMSVWWVGFSRLWSSPCPVKGPLAQRDERGELGEDTGREVQIKQSLFPLSCLLNALSSSHARGDGLDDIRSSPVTVLASSSNLRFLYFKANPS